jgi:hypothetical protein
MFFIVEGGIDFVYGEKIIFSLNEGEIYGKRDFFSLEKREENPF